MTEIENILNQFLTQFADEIKSGIKSSSGKTHEQIQVVISTTKKGIYDNVKGELQAPKYIGVFEDGRQPTKNGNSGGATLQQRILAWIRTRSFSFPLAPKYPMTRAIKSAESLSWAIAIKIHREGNLLFRNGGKSGVISNVITANRVDAFILSLGNKSSRLLLNKVVANIMKS